MNGSGVYSRRRVSLGGEFCPLKRRVRESSSSCVWNNNDAEHSSKALDGIFFRLVRVEIISVERFCSSSFFFFLFPSATTRLVWCLLAAGLIIRLLLALSHKTVRKSKATARLSYLSDHKLDNCSIFFSLHCLVQRYVYTGCCCRLFTRDKLQPNEPCYKNR